MKRFEVGKNYRMVSPCDTNCAWYYTVTKRTAKTVTLLDFDKKETIVRRVAEMKAFDRVTGVERGEEYCKPLGDFSMCPILWASKDI